MKKIASVAILVFLSSISAHAQDALLKAQERAKYLGDYLALLEHENPTMRLAAVEEALLSDDVQLRTLALDAAFSSDDQRLQTTAIRWYVQERESIPVTLTLPDRPTDGQLHIYQTWSALILNKIDVFGQDEIKFMAKYASGGQLIRGGMELRFVAGNIGCTLTVRPAGPTLLAGQFACNFGTGYSETFGEEKNALVARIDLS